MDFKHPPSIGLLVAALWAPAAFGFVHISSLKPRLPVAPDRPTITLQWNGEAPALKEKAEVLDGAYAEASDSEMMEALLRAAIAKWNNVETSYLDFKLEVNAGIVKDPDDEVYAIVVESYDSESVAAAAVPMFRADEPGNSPNKQNGRIIYDCDISMARSKVSAKALLRTMTHELGHCIGLGHPHSSYHSIMSYSSLSSSSEHGLDDKAGVSFLYPEPAYSQDVKYMTSCGSIAGASGGGFWVLCLPLALVCCGRRKPWG